MKIFTIGFTKKSAATFFGLLQMHNMDALLDIRLKPNSQLAGYAKQRDLKYFLKEICAAEYQHHLDLAPSEETFSQFRSDKNWDSLQQSYLAEIEERKIATTLDQQLFSEKNTVLLCSEHKPDKCHRRLLAEYLQQQWPDVEIVHLF